MYQITLKLGLFYYSLHITFSDSLIRTELKIFEDLFTISNSRFSVASTIIVFKDVSCSTIINDPYM